MEKKLILNAEKRLPEENVKHLRKQRIIPAVVYWRKQDAISLKLDYSEFLRLYRISWESKIVALNIDGKKIDVLVYDVKKNPISWDFQHIDFFAITKWEKVTTNIPFVFVWTAKASVEGAIIEEQMKEIEIKVLPKDLVDSFEIDLSLLENIWDSIRVEDLKIDREKFEITMDDETAIIVTAAQPAKIVEEEPIDDAVSEGWEEVEEATEDKESNE